MDYIKNIKDNDYDKFITSLFAKDELIEDLLVLYSLKLELAKVVDLATNEMVGFIRLKWWHDEIIKIYDQSPVYLEILKKLSDIISKYNIPKEDLLKYIETFEYDIAENKFQNYQEFYDYLKNKGLLNKIICQVLNVKVDKEFLDNMALFTGITDYLRSFRSRFDTNRLYFEDNMLEPSKLPYIFKELIDMCHISYKKFQEQYSNLPKEHISKLRPLLLQVSIGKLYLNQIVKNNNDCLHPEIKINRLKMLLILYFRALFNKF